MYPFFVRFSNIVFVFGFWFVIILYCILVCSSFGFCMRSFKFWGLIMRLVLVMVEWSVVLFFILDFLLDFLFPIFFAS